MVRAAAKNHGSVGVLVDPADYDASSTSSARDGGLSSSPAPSPGGPAFRHTAAYDAAVADWFQREDHVPAQLHLAVPVRQELRYGENPHQQAAFYALPDAGGIAAAEQLHGKELSYNNLLDTDAAWGMAVELEEPCVAIIKHTNPAGYAVADDLETAYARALEGDPVSAFGGSSPATGSSTPPPRRITEVFTEVVIAPGYDDDALEVLQAKKNLRILRVPPTRTRPGAARQLRSVAGGLLRAGRRHRRGALGRLGGRHPDAARRGHPRRPALRLDRREAHQVQRHRARQPTGRSSASGPGR
jgi:phosphoribosylaminoimidazolecarboxamide formyltransferase / IMP cyclohydrolase